MEPQPQPAKAPLPKPSAELVLLRVFFEAHVETLPRKERVRYVRAVTEIMQHEAALEHVVNFRPKTDGAAVANARATAHAWLQQVVGRVLTRL